MSVRRGDFLGLIKLIQPRHVSCPLALLGEWLQAAQYLPYMFLVYSTPGGMSNVSGVIHDDLDLGGELCPLYQWAGRGTVRTISKSSKL